MKLTSSLLIDLINFVSSTPQIKAILAARDANEFTFGSGVSSRFLKKDPVHTTTAYYQVNFVFITKASMEEKDDVSVIVVADHSNGSPSFRIHNVQYY